MKRIFVITLALLIGIQVVSLPVLADNDGYVIPFDSIDAYAYFDSKGMTNHGTGLGVSGQTIQGGTYSLYCDSKSTVTSGFSCRFIQTGTQVSTSTDRFVGQLPSISGNWRYTGTYDPKSFLSFNDYDNYVYLEFLSSRQIWSNVYIGRETKGVISNVELLFSQYVMSATSTPMFHYAYRFKPGERIFSIDFPDLAGVTDLIVVPVLLKQEKQLTDLERSRFGLPTSSVSAINDFKAITVKKFDELISVMGGYANDPKLKESINKLDDKRNQYDSTNEQYQALENSFSDSMNQNLVKIDTSPKLTSNNHFINSMKFVSDLYTKLVINTPFEQILMFTATLGIALVLIGKLRNR